MKRFSETMLLAGLFIIGSCCQLPIIARSPVPYIISYRLPNNASANNAVVPIYYKGFRVNPGIDNEGASVLPEPGVPLLFHVVFAKQVVPCESHNNVMCWECPDKKTCALYELKLSINRSDEGDIKDYHWDIKPFPQDKIPKRLPENALLVLFDPTFIDELSDDPTTHAPGSIMLPMINFRDNDKNRFEDAVVFAAMAALDIDHFNRREYTRKVNKNTMVIIPTEGY